MAQASVTLRVAPSEFNLIISTLENERDSLNDLAKDPVAKAEDRHQAKAESIQLENLIRQLME